MTEKNIILSPFMTYFTLCTVDNIGGGIVRTLYLDVFFFINMLEDYLLLLCVKRIMHTNIKNSRIILASVCGAVLSLTSLLDINFFPVNLLINTVCCFLITLICFGYKSRRRYFKSAFTLIAVSMLFSGAMIFFYLAFKPDGMVIINNTVYFDISPVILILLTLIIYALLFLFRKLFKNHGKKSLTHKVNFLYRNNNYDILCKTDSGCNAREPFSGASVIIIQDDKVNAEAGFNENFRLIPFKSLGGDGLIRGFKASQLKIDGKSVFEEVYIGLYEGSFDGETDGLIPQNLIKE